MLWVSLLRICCEGTDPTVFALLCFGFNYIVNISNAYLWPIFVTLNIFHQVLNIKKFCFIYAFLISCVFKDSLSKHNYSPINHLNNLFFYSVLSHYLIIDNVLYLSDFSLKRYCWGYLIINFIVISQLRQIWINYYILVNMKWVVSDQLV